MQNLTCKGTLRKVFICLRPRTRYHPPPLYTLCTYSHREGGEGGELNQRERERGNRGYYRSQSWVEKTKMTECTQEIGYLQYINSVKHLSPKVLHRSNQMYELKHFGMVWQRRT
jgi:hypothetical protein